jgi:tagaturonate epimerase
MEGCIKFLRDLGEKQENVESMKKLARNGFDTYSVYPDSIHTSGGSILFIAGYDGFKVLVVYGESSLYDEFKGEVTAHENGKIKICSLSIENNKVLRRAFQYTNPSNHKGNNITIGLGDRLGLASPAHIRLVKDYNVFPVLAQQSIRELNMTGRTYEEVLAAASWAVFQEGYTKGFGADGDHLKTTQEVKMALDCGFTMITLDCSEHIDNGVASLSKPEIGKAYSELPGAVKQQLEAKYLSKEFKLGDGSVITFTPDEFKKTVLVYYKAINYTIDVYNEVIKNYERNVDFEMSIDETLTPTTPESHYFVASELIDGGVDITSLAPRFCGEFQKGIDYRGDKLQFTTEFQIHAKIAEKLGYKISVHSGSDKFDIFPIVGEKTGSVYHLKTAGTNWLEAVRVIARYDPSLYRRMHLFALSKLDEAKKFYHICADTAKIPELSTLKDEQLPGLMEFEDSRQVLHITYGFILLAKNSDGTSVFKDEIYSFLNKYEDKYYNSLMKHIGRHLQTLGIV